MAQRISIGIESSPSVGLRVSDDELKKLQDALGSKGDWVEIDGEDGTLKLAVDKVCWLKVEKDEARVGFGRG